MYGLYSYLFLCLDGSPRFIIICGGVMSLECDDDIKTRVGSCIGVVCVILTQIVKVGQKIWVYSGGSLIDR